MDKIISKIEKLYTENIENYGIDSKSVGWPDQKKQFLRFDKLLEVIDDKDEIITVNDLGCGFGSQFKYMVEKGYNIKEYHGYDISEKMIEAAKTYANSKNTMYYHESKLKTLADYSFTSGIFNVKYDTAESDWEEYVKETLQNMNEYSVKGFAYNVLSEYVDYKQEHLYYADPLKYFDYCKRHISRYVTLLHDYPLYEWTIIVRKG